MASTSSTITVADLHAWVRAVVEHASTYSGLADLLVAADAGSELHDDCARITAIGEAPVAGARTAGAVRADLRGEDVFALTNAASWARAGL
ncbi:hypothetical protein WIS52_20140 [Pseudonocardia nematodicida]|uniref:Transcriptional regulator SbtR-like C-terminal domain-containing protein n=1 Tax=Pseudonocardia nematodicida TaxID=1206997 RepID=A0ABV1KFW3_9PSEU